MEERWSRGGGVDFRPPSTPPPPLPSQEELARSLPPKKDPPTDLLAVDVQRARFDRVRSDPFRTGPGETGANAPPKAARNGIRRGTFASKRRAMEMCSREKPETYSSSTRISTRLFLFLPSRVPLSARGLYSPQPAQETRFASTPAVMRASAATSERWRERSRFP